MGKAKRPQIVKQIRCKGCDNKFDPMDMRQYIVDHPTSGFGCPHGCGRTWGRVLVLDVLEKCGIPLPVLHMAPLATDGDEDPLAEWFTNYHTANPKVYEAFKEMAYEIRKQGHQRYGAKTIMERLRWESLVRYGGEFKLANNVKDRCSARYVRLLIQEDPSFEGFFETRRVTTEETRAKLSEAHKKP